MRLVSVSVSMLALVVALPTAVAQSRVVSARIGHSIGGVRIGMTRPQVASVLRSLRPEGIDRAAGVTGFYSGPVLVLFDAAGVVQHVSVQLSRTAGIRVGTV